jgi:hypothetical protein
VRRARKVDRNHAEVRDVLRSLCLAVEDLSDVGRGIPDLLVKTARAKVYLVEVKDGLLSPSRRRLTDDEVRVQARWGSSYRVVHSVDEAIELAKQ